MPPRLPLMARDFAAALAGQDQQPRTPCAAFPDF
jgi:hypothetical protein